MLARGSLSKLMLYLYRRVDGVRLRVSASLRWESPLALQVNRANRFASMRRCSLGARTPGTAPAGKNQCFCLFAGARVPGRHDSLVPGG